MSEGLVVRSLVPLANVASVGRSEAFYAKLGFRVGQSFTPEGCAEPTWAWLTTGSAQLMVGTAEGPVAPGPQAVLFYAYCEDVEAMHRQLAADGLQPGPITSPFYAPRGEFRLTDPDGYVVMVTHT